MKSIFALLFSIAVFLPHSAQASDPISLIAPGSVWSYSDSGFQQPPAWVGLNFKDALWASGAARLGYGNGGEATTVSFGFDPNNKIITTYFRNKFSVTDASAFKYLLLRLQVDDGAVVYVNGQELMRTNLPAGPINSRTLALVSIEGTLEQDFLEFFVPSNLLVNGQNILAVEVHQASVQSSDMGFDLELIGYDSVPPLQIAKLDNGVQISWPDKPSSFNLFSSATIDADASWSPVTNNVSILNSRKSVNLDASASSRFFLLKNIQNQN